MDCQHCKQVSRLYKSTSKLCDNKTFFLKEPHRTSKYIRCKDLQRNQTMEWECHCYKCYQKNTFEEKGFERFKEHQKHKTGEKKAKKQKTKKTKTEKLKTTKHHKDTHKSRHVWNHGGPPPAAPSRRRNCSWHFDRLVGRSVGGLRVLACFSGWKKKHVRVEKRDVSRNFL